MVEEAETDIFTLTQRLEWDGSGNGGHTQCDNDDSFSASGDEDDYLFDVTDETFILSGKISRKCLCDNKKILLLLTLTMLLVVTIIAIQIYLYLDSKPQNKKKVNDFFNYFDLL